jgi:YnbE-like lipoprotein
MKRILAMLAVSVAVGCSPIVRVEAPREPITINVNVKLDADVRVKLEEQAHKDVAKNPEIF